MRRHGEEAWKRCAHLPQVPSSSKARVVMPDGDLLDLTDVGLDDFKAVDRAALEVVRLRKANQQAKLQGGCSRRTEQLTPSALFPGFSAASCEGRGEGAGVDGEGAGCYPVVELAGSKPSLVTHDLDFDLCGAGGGAAVRVRRRQRKVTVLGVTQPQREECFPGSDGASNEDELTQFSVWQCVWDAAYPPPLTLASVPAPRTSLVYVLMRYEHCVPVLLGRISCSTAQKPHDDGKDGGTMR